LCVDQAVIDEVVRELHHLGHRAALDLALSVGRLIVEKFYGGRTDVWRQRSKRCASFRKLAARPDLPISAAGLYRAVAIYEVWQRIGDVATWKHVGASHLRAVLSLPAVDQDALLHRAETDNLSVRQLEVAVAELRAAGTDRRGRPRQSVVVRTVRQLERTIDGFQATVDGAQLDTLDESSVNELRTRLGRLRRRCDEIVASLPIDVLD
jgi:hypothetical protein